MASIQDDSRVISVSTRGHDNGTEISLKLIYKNGGFAVQVDENAEAFEEPEPHPVWDGSEFNRSFWRAAIAEFIATLLFVYIGVSAAIGNGRETPNGVGSLGVAWAFGATIFVLVYCTAGVSGASILLYHPEFSFCHSSPIQASSPPSPRISFTSKCINDSIKLMVIIIDLPLKRIILDRRENWKFAGHKYRVSECIHLKEHFISKWAFYAFISPYCPQFDNSSSAGRMIYGSTLHTPLVVWRILH